MCLSIRLVFLMKGFQGKSYVHCVNVPLLFLCFRILLVLFLLHDSLKLFMFFPRERGTKYQVYFFNQRVVYVCHHILPLWFIMNLVIDQGSQVAITFTISISSNTFYHFNKIGSLPLAKRNPSIKIYGVYKRCRWTRKFSLEGSSIASLTNSIFGLATYISLN